MGVKVRSTCRATVGKGREDGGEGEEHLQGNRREREEGRTEGLDRAEQVGAPG